MANDDCKSESSTYTTQVTYVGPVGAPNIEKLEGTKNYDIWKFQMKMALIDYGLWNCVSGTDTDENRDQRALAKLCLSVKPVCLAHLRTAKSSKDGWNNLEKAFQSSGLTRRMFLKRKLYRARYEDFSSMNEYVSGILDMVQELSELSVTISDDEIGTLLLCGLPDSHDAVVNGFCATHSCITSSDVITMLTELSDRHNLREDIQAKENALLFKGKPQGSNVNPNTRFVPICHECQKPGHIRPKCPKLRKKFKKFTPKDFSTKTDSSSVDKNDRCKRKDTLLFSTAMAVNNLDPNEFYVDSCASKHVSCRKDWMMNFNSDASSVFCTADKGILSATGAGDIPVCLTNLYNKHVRSGTITNVMYAPDVAANLLSVNQIALKGHILVFDKNGFNVYNEDEISVQGTVKFTGSEIGGIYKLDRSVSPINFTVHNCDVDQNVIMSTSQSASSTLWHKRLGHLCTKSLILLRNGLANGIVFQDSKISEQPCVPCIEAKQTRKSFPKGQARRATSRLELVHTDLVGPMSEDSWGGAKYVLMFTDDYSRKTFGYLLKSKSETFSKFVEFKSLVENQTGLNIKRVRSDNGLEYCNSQFNNLFKSAGIVHETTVPYCPEQNSVQERANRVVVEKARALLADSGLPKPYWGEAINTAIYLKNRSPTVAVKGALPEELWTGSKVNLQHLKVFGCRTYSHIPKKFRRKFDVKSKPMIMVGYCENSKGYRLADPDQPGKIEKARDVIFLEHVMHNIKNSVLHDNYRSDIQLEESQVETPIQSVPNLYSNAESIEDTNGPLDTSDDALSDDIVSGSDIESHDAEHETDMSQNSARTKQHPLRERKPPNWLTKDYVYHLTDINLDEVPNNIQEALNGSKRKYWVNAIKEEYNSLIKNNVWELVDRPTDVNIVSCKWVFKIKKDIQGNERHKARLVARGFSQSYGFDYFETFSPVARISTIRLLIALSAQLNLLIEHFDVVTAFLHGDLSEKVYMSLPEGFDSQDKTGKICLLKKAIYGLKQSSRAWNSKVNNVLLDIGYKKSKNEPCLFYNINKDSIVIIILYVDDFFVFHNNCAKKEILFNKLKEKFHIKDLGNAQQILGMKIYRENGKIYLNQCEYIASFLKKFGFLDAKGVSTPLEHNLHFKKCSDDLSDLSVPYQNVIGCLMYLAVTTRPDIAHTVSVLSQFNVAHNAEHWNGVKRLIRYIKSTMNLGISFDKTDNFSLEGFSDASWGDDPEDRKSYTGFVFKLAKGPISWESRKQKTVALSSSEAEYIAASDACKEAVYLGRLLCEIYKEQKKDAIVLHVDNQSAIKIAENPMYHGRTKHIGIRYHFIREIVAEGKVCLSYLPTEYMVADVLTKGLSKVKHSKCLDGLGMTNT